MTAQGPLSRKTIISFQCVLHFMVGSTEGADGVSRDIINVLLTSGLMKELVSTVY